MSLIALPEAVRHLRLVDDYPVDQVEPYLLAAEGHARSYLGRTVHVDQAEMAAAVLDGSASDDPVVLNDEIRAGILLILGHLFRNREAAAGPMTQPELPVGAYSLLQPYRVGMGV